MSTKITYNNTEIANFSDGAKVLKCKDKTMASDVIVESEGGGGGIPELPLPSTWANQSFTLDKDYQISQPYPELGYWELPDGYTLTIPEGTTLTIYPEAIELDVYGSITVNGRLKSYPYVYGEGIEVTVNGFIELNGAEGLILNGSGEVNYFGQGDGYNCEFNLTHIYLNGTVDGITINNDNSSVTFEASVIGQIDSIICQQFGLTGTCKGVRFFSCEELNIRPSGKYYLNNGETISANNLYITEKNSLYVYGGTISDVQDFDGYINRFNNGGTISPTIPTNNIINWTN